MTLWRFPQEPVRKAAVLDFHNFVTVNGPSPTNETKDDTLMSVEHSPGDWTLYLIRQLPDNFDPFVQVADVREVHVQVGYGEAQDSQLMETINNLGVSAFSAWGGRNRAQMLHYHGSTVQVRVKWNIPSTAPGNGPDKLVGWVSPSRPAKYELPFIGTMDELVIPSVTFTTDPIRIPIWATTLNVLGNALDFASSSILPPGPVYAAWSDWFNTNTVGPGVSLCQPGADVPIPTDARFVRFTRPVGAVVPGNIQFVSGVFNCRS